MVNQVSKDEQTCKTILFDKDISNIYSYSAISQIKDMLRAFKNDPGSLRLIIKDVILNWKRQEQYELAECLVNCFLCRHDSNFPNSPLAERLYDIIDVDMQILSDKGRLDSFLSGSFSMKIFDQIAKLPESQNYIKQTMGKIYETLDYDYLETIDLEASAFECKAYMDYMKSDRESRDISDGGSFNDSSRRDSEESFDEFIIPSSPVKKGGFVYEEQKTSKNTSRATNLPSSPRMVQKSRLPINEPAMHKRHSNIIDIKNSNFFEKDDFRKFSIALAPDDETDEQKLKRIKNLQQKFELCKLTLKTLLEAIYVTPRYIPTIIRIFLKIVSELYEKHSKINSSFYSQSSDLSKNSDNGKSKIRNEIHRLLIDILATKWLVNSLFLTPDKAGLIINRPIQKLQDLFLRLSKVFVYSLRGKLSSKNPSEEIYMTLFSSFIEKHYKNSK